MAASAPERNILEKDASIRNSHFQPLPSSPYSLHVSAYATCKLAFAGYGAILQVS